MEARDHSYVTGGFFISTLSLTCFENEKSRVYCFCMTQTNILPQTPEETQKEIKLAKQHFEDSMRSIKREYKELIASIDEKEKIKKIKNVWTDPNI